MSPAEEVAKAARESIEFGDDGLLLCAIDAAKSDLELIAIAMEAGDAHMALCGVIRRLSLAMALESAARKGAPDAA